MARPRQTRETREQQTRAANPAHPEEFDVSDYYLGTSLLRTPQPPEGYVYRWIRVGREGAAPDVKNMQRRQHEGWSPVPPDSLPQTEGEFIDMTTNIRLKGQLTSVVQVDDLVLMQRPAGLQEKARRLNRARIDRQLQAVNENFFRDTRGGKPEHGFAFRPDHKTRVSRGAEPASVSDMPIDTGGVHAEDIL